MIDYLDFDVDPDKWIDRLMRQLAEGSYQPSVPRRFSLGKSRGFSRQMTLPAIPDLVLYRALVDLLFSRARQSEAKHGYFDRAALSDVQRRAVGEARQHIEEASQYATLGYRRFLAWLRYDQYRKHLIVDKIYPYLVVTDVTNFFDSILYSRIADALAGIANARQLGLLLFVLERLSIRDSFTESPRVGLPVDEFDCSRVLAHMVLFPHDRRMVDAFGSEAYVRWMDDQNIGVASKAGGLSALATIGDSLTRLHLTGNYSKSRVLSLAEAKAHFHFRANAKLDLLEAAPSKTLAERRSFRFNLREAWREAVKAEGTGEWEKVLKRMHRLAAISDSRFLRRRAKRDMLACPSLANRISQYMVRTGPAREYLDFARNVWTDPEQIYSDVNVALLEAMLRIEPDVISARELRDLAHQVVRLRIAALKSSECLAIAPLLLLRFGDRRSLPTLKALIERQHDRLPVNVVRSCSVVFASYGRNEFHAVRRVAGRLLFRELADMVRLLERILEYTAVPDRYKARLALRRDGLSRRHFVDMRALLAARMLLLNDRTAIRRWIEKQASTWKTVDISDYDRDLLTKLL